MFSDRRLARASVRVAATLTPTPTTRERRWRRRTEREEQRRRLDKEGYEVDVRRLRDHVRSLEGLVLHVDLARTPLCRKRVPLVQSLDELGRLLGKEARRVARGNALRLIDGRRVALLPAYLHEDRRKDEHQVCLERLRYERPDAVP